MKTDSETRFLLISHDIMLGDGDKYIRGTALVEESFWAKQCKDFKQAVLNTYDPSVFTDEQHAMGDYTVAVVVDDGYDLEIGVGDYKVQECTLEEAQVLNKFLASKSFQVQDGVVFTRGSWRELTYWIDNLS